MRAILEAPPVESVVPNENYYSLSQSSPVMFDTVPDVKPLRASSVREIAVLFNLMQYRENGLSVLIVVNSQLQSSIANPFPQLLRLKKSLRAVLRPSFGFPADFVNIVQ